MCYNIASAVCFDSSGKVCGILAPQPEIEPTPPASEDEVLTTREIPQIRYILKLKLLILKMLLKWFLFYVTKIGRNHTLLRGGKVEGLGLGHSQHKTNKPWPPSLWPSEIFIPLGKGPKLEPTSVFLWLCPDLCSIPLQALPPSFRGTENTFPTGLPGPQKTKIWRQTQHPINISTVTPHLPPPPLGTRNPYRWAGSVSFLHISLCMSWGMQDWLPWQQTKQP